MEPGDIMEPPTYTVATDFDEIKQLRHVIDVFRGNHGRLLQLLIKRLSIDRREAKELVETMVHHPRLEDLLGH